MKTTKYFFFSALAISLVSFAACKKTEQPPQPSGSIVTYESGADIPDYEKMALSSYTVSEKARLDENGAKAMVQRTLEASGAMTEFNTKESVKDGDRLWYRNPKDPSAILNVDLRNGDVALNRGMRPYMGNTVTPDLMKNDDAVNAAKTYLQKMGVDLSDEKSIYMSHVGGVNLGTHDEKQGEKTYEKFTTVRFDRRLDGISVLGHSRVLLQLAEKGKVQSFIKQWAPVDGAKVAPEQVAKKDEVKRSLEDHLTKENEGASKITVKKIVLVYYDDGKGIMEPALHVICEVEYPGVKGAPSQKYKHDTVEPLLKQPRMSYTFTGEKHDAEPKKTDEVNQNEPIQRGPDEKK
jgi:hypothetical protein